MGLIARILGWSLLASGFGAGLGLVFFGQYGYRDYIVPTFFLACVGGIIGAVAGATREIVTAMHEKPLG
jgi:hypothetical protein